MVKYHHDPRETLDYFYQTMLEQLTKVRRTVRDLATNRQRIELQLNVLKQQEQKARRNLDRLATSEEAGLAEMAKTQLASVERNLQSLQKQLDKAVAREEEETRKSLSMTQIVDSFRTNKEAFKAEYSIATGVSSGAGEFDRRQNSADDEIDDDRAVRLGAVTDLLSPDLAGAGETTDQDHGNSGQGRG